jgi:hypothetical protein
VLFKVRFERSPQDIRHPDLERGVGLGVVLPEGDGPGCPLADEGFLEDKVGEIAPPQRDKREEPDQETVAMAASRPTRFSATRISLIPRSTSSFDRRKWVLPRAGR